MSNTEETIPMPEEFFQGYVECALWSSTDENGQPLDIYDDSDIDPASLARMRDDCEYFYNAQHDLIAESGLSDSRAGHDFWLSRNRHGAGFFDEGVGAVFQELQAAARVYGESNLYDVDGVVYLA